MSESYDFTRPDVIVPGASGRPGDRTFFLQAVEGARTCSFKVEKQQVAALCDEPLGLLWAVGRLAVAYEEADDRIVIVAEEMFELDDDSLDPDLDYDDPEVLAAAGIDPSSARFSMSRAQVAAFIAVGNDLVRAGRAQCRLCGKPIDAEGHACPRLN